jgi:hypothetical protein
MNTKKISKKYNSKNKSKKSKRNNNKIKKCMFGGDGACDNIYIQGDNIDKTMIDKVINASERIRIDIVKEKKKWWSAPKALQNVEVKKSHCIDLEHYKKKDGTLNYDTLINNLKESIELNNGEKIRMSKINMIHY